MSNKDLINKIHHGDSLEVMRKIEDESIDLILCDLPYGITANKWDVVIPLDALWEQYERIIKPNGAIVLCAAHGFTIDLIISNRDLYKYRYIWVKSYPTGFLNAKKAPLRQHEDVCVFYKSLPTYNPQFKRVKHEYRKRKGKRYMQQNSNWGKKVSVAYDNKGVTYPRDVQFFEYHTDSSNKRLHPTEKPVSMGVFFVRTYTNPDDVVLDNTCGSGTFPLAAFLEDRNYIGIESNPDYVKIARKRIRDAGGEDYHFEKIEMPSERSDEVQMTFKF